MQALYFLAAALFSTSVSADVTIPGVSPACNTDINQYNNQVMTVCQAAILSQDNQQVVACVCTSDNIALFKRITTDCDNLASQAQFNAAFNQLTSLCSSNGAVGSVSTSTTTAAVQTNKPSSGSITSFAVVAGAAVTALFL